MMGERRVQQQLCFTSFRSSGTCWTRICSATSTFVELGGLRRELLPFYSEMGRPSIEPGAADSDADRQLLLRYPLGAAARRCTSTSRIASLGGHGVSTPFVQCGH